MGYEFMPPVGTTREWLDVFAERVPNPDRLMDMADYRNKFPVIHAFLDDVGFGWIAKDSKDLDQALGQRDLTPAGFFVATESALRAVCPSFNIYRYGLENPERMGHLQRIFEEEKASQGEPVGMPVTHQEIASVFGSIMDTVHKWKKHLMGIEDEDDEDDTDVIKSTGLEDFFGKQRERD